MGILVFELSHLLLPRIYLIHITNISTTSTAVQGTLGQQKFRPFLCVSAMWVQHAAGLHAFTAKQQSSSRDENKNGDSTAVLAKLLEYVADWYPISGEFCLHDSTQREPQKNYGCERSCIFNLVENWSSSGFFAVPYLGRASWVIHGQVQGQVFCTSSRRRLYRFPGALVTGGPRAGALFTIFLMVIR